ncbi:MAG: hypothetical protein ACFE8M_13790 [Candidatus Hermodarchaeota archaeon]
MKKIKFSLNLGIIGADDSGKDFLIDYLKQIALKNDNNEKLNDFLIMYKDIPVKIKVFHGKHFNQLNECYENIRRLDTIIVIIDIYDLNSFNGDLFKGFEEFNTLYMFKGVSILAGIDKFFIENGVMSDKLRISRINLIQKTKELGFLYYFEIQNKSNDILEIINKFIGIFMIKVSNINPELIERAKTYGKELNNRFNS